MYTLQSFDQEAEWAMGSMSADSPLITRVSSFSVSYFFVSSQKLRVLVFYTLLYKPFMDLDLLANLLTPDNEKPPR